VKFLCVDCDQQMEFADREQPGDGTFAAAFRCPKCGRRIAMLANPMESQLVNSLGIKIGGSPLESQPEDLVRSGLVADPGAAPGTPEPSGRTRPAWTEDAEQRLTRVPTFVRGMVKRIYTDYAVERGITRITPAVMDRARTDLGLESF